MLPCIYMFMHVEMGPFVKVDNSIQWINLYLADSAIAFPNTIRWIVI